MASSSSAVQDCIPLAFLPCTLDRTSSRKEAEIRGIVRNWGCPPEQAIPASIMPQWVPLEFLIYLNRLGKTCSLETSIGLLTASIHSRLERGDRNKDKFLRPRDIKHVIDEVERAKRAAPDGIGEGEPEGQRGRKGKEVCREGENEQREQLRKKGKEALRGSLDSEERETERQPYAEGQVDPARLSQLSAPPSSNQSAPEGDSIISGVSETEPNRCFCAPLLGKELDGTRGPLTDEEGLRLVQRAADFSLERMCHLHLRKLAKCSVGLKNNHKGRAIIDRLAAVHKDSRNLTSFRASHPDWFIKARRSDAPADRLGIYRFGGGSRGSRAPLKPDAQSILERFAGPGAWEAWEKEGTVIIPGVFGYLDQPDLRQLIDHEFAMYQHHSSASEGRPRQGWCRNMYYSLIQQLVRQDPVWYALVATLQGRLDLIAHPYIAKDANAKEKTGFLHLDISVGKYLESAGDGFHLLSSSLSLDDEVDDGCTVVVPGFQYHIREWWDGVLARGQGSSGRATNCSTIYRKEDQEAWGKPKPAPCPAYAVRITRPDIIHGSTSVAPKRRRTLFTWYRAIGPDRETLEGEGTLTWTDLATCHRDQTIPPQEPSGQRLRHAIPHDAFPGSVQLPSPTAIGDALLGRRRWTDPQANHEREVLLGPDADASRYYVKRARERLVGGYKEFWAFMKKNEMAAFGDDSYFRSVEAGGAAGRAADVGMADTEMADAQ